MQELLPSLNSCSALAGLSHKTQHLGRVHIAIPEQWSDINLFRFNFADISERVHIEESCVGSKSNIRA